MGDEMERTALFLDIANLEQAFRRYQVKIDYLGLRDFIADGRSLNGLTHPRQAITNPTKASLVQRESRARPLDPQCTTAPSFPA